MKRKIKGAFCFFLSLLIAAMCCLPSLAAVSYPQGVTNEKAALAAEKTDVLLKNAVNSFSKTGLKELLYKEIFKDETLCTLLTSVYSSLEESGGTLSKLGIDITPKGVARGLSEYKSVAAALEKADSWQTVDLKKVHFSVKDKYQFATAISRILTPFNEVLFTVLCSGTYQAGIIRIVGSDGYETGLISMLSNLGCTWFEEPSTFKSQAQTDKNAMMWNITLSILSLVEEICEGPAMKISRMMPNLAYYIKDGGLQTDVDALLKPFTLHIGNYVSFFSGTQMLSLLMFLTDTKKYTTDFSENINTVFADLTENSDIKLAEIDLEKLKECGTQTQDGVKADIGASFTTCFMWLLETAKLNIEKLEEMLSENKDTKDFTDIAKSLLSKPADEIFKMLVDLLTSEQGKELDYQWQQAAFTPTTVEYTQNLGKEKFERVLKEIDKTANEFVAEFTEEKSLDSTLRKTIYSGETITKLAVTLYSMLEDESLASVASMLSMNFSPAFVASTFSGSQLAAAKRQLMSAQKWSKLKKLDWGFANGNRKGFENAIVAVLAPFEPLLSSLLANGTLQVFDSVAIPGSNGYNTAIIPLLEALGCPSKSIMTYEQYEKGRGTDKIIRAVVSPMLDLLDKICKKPVFTITQILPNAIFFIQNGSLMQCVENLLSPVLSLLETLSIDLSSFGIDLEEIKKLDVLSAIEGMTETLDLGDIKLKKPNLAAVATLGTIANEKSKRTYQGTPVSIGVVKADQTAVLITLLRYCIGIIQDPANSSLVSSLMAPKEGDDSMFSQYSGGIGDRMAEMSVDETIEWLYKLFFRERVVSTKPNEPEYEKTIIYTPQKKSEVKKVVTPIAVIFVVVAIFLILERDRVKGFFERRKEEKEYQRSKNDSATKEEK